MPHFNLARKSGAHRLACLSLYRALLRECGHVSQALGVDASHVTKPTLRSLIGYRFQKDRDLQSPTQIVNGITAGHDFLDLLRSCSAKSADSLNHLGGLLESITLQAEQTTAVRERLAVHWKPPPPSRSKHLEHIQKVKNPANYVSDPSNPRIFQYPQPRSQVRSGVRKVPNLIVTQGIPVLKYSGPQPVLLNRVIKNKVKVGLRRFKQHEGLEIGADLAECEDDWDHIIRKHHGIDDAKAPGRSTSDQATWRQTFVDADHELTDKYVDQQRKHADLGKRLWQIVLAERELKEKERREAKHERRMARKQAATELTAGVAQKDEKRATA
ncbi:hypothetical protein PV11_06274 [Exophiala sideris]|uniref:Complex 1 LYR protein domain-containing protein n=1 Tax=Exophiala sideris TaxID=1016849 RepID=A0A0D1WU26_9EURO|nr:hypothetical protein PV11_06274 [Exophiala sideris]